VINPICELLGINQLLFSFYINLFFSQVKEENKLVALKATQSHHNKTMN